MSGTSAMCGGSGSAGSTPIGGTCVARTSGNPADVSLWFCFWLAGGGSDAGAGSTTGAGAGGIGLKLGGACKTGDAGT
ncbi:hypothetical protein EUA03_11000 [Mycolicibacterium mucogenicum]|uniref:Uncharacterized protein n=1 Tax=Mycolicibacterium mucogenicum TaxID=56689 RepID=A0A4R5WHT1_MYCMU|nr:hypothetical protein EUA03_11000 [Mycolicibacterium mucogenicum]